MTTNNGFTNLEDFAVHLSQALVDIAPEALEVGVRIVRIDAAQTLLLGLLFAFIAGVGVWILWPRREEAEKSGSSQDPFDADLVVILMLVGITVMVVSSAVLLLNIWNWIGLFDPELRLARDVFTRLVAVPQ